MMAARGDFTIITEPFSDAYYFGDDRVSDRFNQDSDLAPRTFSDALAEIHAAAQSGPVFFKDMACHIRRYMTPELLAPFTNLVLTRDPRLSLVSLYKRMPDFTMEEAGFDALHELVELLREEGQDPFVMDGEALRGDPAGVCREFCAAAGISFEPAALQWERGHEPHWDRWQDWFSEASESTQFKKPVSDFDESTLAVPYVQEAVAHCLPLYRSMRRDSSPTGWC